MVDTADDAGGVTPYEALMLLKPDSLAETDWAVQAGVNRGFFTNLKSRVGSPRMDSITKLLAFVNRSMSDYEAVRGGKFVPREEVVSPDTPPTHSADGGETVGIVSLDLSLAMGTGTLIEDFIESELVEFDVAMLRRVTRTPFDRLRMVTGIGTSHEPRFHTNDQFLIDISDRRLTRIDGYYWITFDGAHALKRLRPLGNGRLQIISENPSYEPMDVAADEVRIEGRAIWVARAL